jgi:hypothetical protein
MNPNNGRERSRLQTPRTPSLGSLYVGVKRPHRQGQGLEEFDPNAKHGVRHRTTR